MKITVTVAEIDAQMSFLDKEASRVKLYANQGAKWADEKIELFGKVKETLRQVRQGLQMGNVKEEPVKPG